MALIEWTEGLRVNIVEIDRQHQHLVGMINELHAAMLRHQGRDVLSGILDGLVDYAGTHFQTEEKHFERFAYPDALAHKQEHADFTRIVGGFKADHDAGVLGLSVELMPFLRNWLHDHIERADKKYVPFFHEHGLK